MPKRSPPRGFAPPMKPIKPVDKVKEHADPGRRARFQERRTRAWQLRLQGYEYAAIGKALGVSSVHAFRICQEALKELREQEFQAATEWRDIHTRRYERILRILNDKVTKGDTRGIRAYLKAMHQEANLLGLNSPTKIAPTTPEGDRPYDPTENLSDDELYSRAKRVVALEEARRAAALDAAPNGGNEGDSQG